MAKGLVVAAVGLAACLLPGTPAAAGGPPTMSLGGGYDAVLDASGAGWVVAERQPFGITVGLFRRAADGTRTAVGPAFSPQDGGTCATTALGGSPARPYLLDGLRLCAVAEDGTVTPLAVPAGTRAGETVVDAEGTIWFAGSGATALGRIDPEGSLHSVALPGSGSITALGLGPDGGVRAARGATVAEVGAGGAATLDVTLPDLATQLLTGPDGRLWAWLGCAGCATRLVAVDGDGSTDVVVANGPAQPGRTLAAGGRAWWGDGTALVGVEVSGAIRRLPLGLTDGGYGAFPVDGTVRVLDAVGDDLVGVQRRGLWRLDAGTPVVALDATVRGDLGPGGGHVVHVDPRDPQGAPVAGTVDVFRLVRGAGTLAPYSYSREVSVHVDGPDEVTVDPVPCGAPADEAPSVVVFTPDDAGLLGGQVVLRSVAPTRASILLVRGVFARALGRAPEPAALEHWVGRVGTDPLRTVVDPLLRTREAEVRVVDQVFRQALGRRLDAASAEHWRAALRRSGQARVTAQVVASAEAHRRAGGTDAAWVDHAHSALLGRAPTPGERAAAVGRLATGTARGTIAMELLRSAAGVAHRVSVVRLGLGLDPAPQGDEVARFTTEEALRRTLAVPPPGEACPG